MKRLILLLPLILLASPELFKEGNALYEEGRYAEAQDAYLSAIDNGYISASVYYNLGNAFFKNNQNPQAILAYERARIIDPRDEQIQRNIAYSRMFCPDKINSMFDGTFFGNFWGFLRFFTYSEVRYTTIALFGLMAIFLFIHIISIKKKRRILRRIATIFGILGVLALSVYITKMNDRWLLNAAIVLEPETDVMSSPTDSGELLFTINPGTKVVILEKYEDHRRIAIEDGREGWIESSAVERVLPE